MGTAPCTQTDALRGAISNRSVLHVRRWPSAIKFDLGDVERFLFVGAPFAEDRILVVSGQQKSIDGTGLLASEIHRRFADGDSIVLRSAHRSIPELTRFSADLASSLDAEVRVNVYITPPASSGFPLHYDDHDVVMLQTFGKKYWQIHDKTATPQELSQLSSLQRAIVAATSQHVLADSHQMPASELVLSAGDMLYLPSGVPHCGTARDAASIHITASIFSPSAAEVSSLITFANQLQLESRSQAPRLQQPNQMIQSLIELQREKERPPTPSRYLESLSMLSSITDETWCEWRPNLKPRIDRVGEAVIVGFYESAVPVDAALLPMWKYVVSTPKFKVRNLPLEDGAERQIAAAELVRAGLLQLVGAIDTLDS